MHLFEDVEQLKIPDIGEKLIFKYFAKRSKVSLSDEKGNFVKEMSSKDFSIFF